MSKRLDELDVKMLARRIKRDNDCAYMCRATAAFMARSSEFSRKLASLCADICKACADWCEKHKSMEHCKKCAAACRAYAGEYMRIARGAHFGSLPLLVSRKSES